MNKPPASGPLRERDLRDKAKAAPSGWQLALAASQPHLGPGTRREWQTVGALVSYGRIKRSSAAGAWKANVRYEALLFHYFFSAPLAHTRPGVPPFNPTRGDSASVCWHPRCAARGASPYSLP